MPSLTLFDSREESQSLKLVGSSEKVAVCGCGGGGRRGKGSVCGD